MQAQFNLFFGTHILIMIIFNELNNVMIIAAGALPPAQVHGGPHERATPTQISRDEKGQR